jgi:adenylate cyclase
MLNLTVAGREEPLRTQAVRAQALPQGPTVAILPLRNLTGNPKQDYFIDGLTEEMTSELARYQDLRVIAPYSTLRWKDREFDAREIGRDLGARFLLWGSLRQQGRTIKVSARLVDALSGSQLWGEDYRRELRPDSLIALQEEVGRQVVARLGSFYGIITQTLSRESRRKPPEELATYEAFLRFYHHAASLSPQTFAETLPVLEQAAAREPESGLAWGFLSLLYTQAYSLQFAPLESPLEKALAAAQKGAVLEPEIQMVRAALAQVYFFRNQREPFLMEADAALALNPNAPTPIGFLGWLLALYGEWERGLAILEEAIALNPHYPGWFHVAPLFRQVLQGRYAEAYQEALALRLPQLFWDPLLRAALLGRLGRRPEAARALAELLRLRPDFAAAGRFLISCYVKSDGLLDALLVGLRRAGLSV